MQLIDFCCFIFQFDDYAICQLVKWLLCQITMDSAWIKAWHAIEIGYNEIEINSIGL